MNSEKIIELIEAFAEANADLSRDQMTFANQTPAGVENVPVVNAYVEQANYYGVRSMAANELAELVRDLVAKENAA